MKAYRSIFGILVLVALAGCTKIEFAPAPEKEITFSVAEYASAQTKASASLESQGIESFNSKGFLHAIGVEGVQDFFGASGETISKQESVWTPSHPYYWPKSEFSYVNFVSWYDYLGTPSNVSEERLEWNNRTISHNDNIMYADEAWRYNDNPTNGPQYTNDAITKGVPAIFHHALARVKFQARLSEASEGNVSWTAAISNFKVENVHKTGSISFRNSDPGTSFTTKPWDNASWIPTEAVDTLSRPANITLDGNTKVLMNSRSVLPQSTFGMLLTFDYTIITTYNITGNTLTEVRENATASVNLYSDFKIYNWDMNTSITYTLVFDPKTNKITFDPVLTEDWNTDLNNATYIE